MKNIKNWALCFSLFAVFEVCVGQGTLEDALYASLLETTRSAWGVDKDVFSLCAESNMVALGRMRTARGRQCRYDWLMELASWSVPTNDSQTSCAWLDQKASWLAGAGRSFCSPDATNLWYAISDVVRGVRTVARSDDAIVEEYLRRSSVVTNSIAVSSGLPRDVEEQLNMQHRREKAVSSLVRLIVQTYGQRALSRFDAEMRAMVYSNLVQRAGLTEGEAARLRRNAKLPEQTREAVLFGANRVRPDCHSRLPQ